MSCYRRYCTLPLEGSVVAAEQEPAETRVILSQAVCPCGINEMKWLHLLRLSVDEHKTKKLKLKTKPRSESWSVSGLFRSRTRSFSRLHRSSSGPSTDFKLLRKHDVTHSVLHRPGDARLCGLFRASFCVKLNSHLPSVCCPISSTYSRRTKWSVFSVYRSVLE